MAIEPPVPGLVTGRFAAAGVGSAGGEPVAIGAGAVGDGVGEPDAATPLVAVGTGAPDAGAGVGLPVIEASSLGRTDEGAPEILSAIEAAASMTVRTPSAACSIGE